jgi:hypothetical protein
MDDLNAIECPACRAEERRRLMAEQNAKELEDVYKGGDSALGDAIIAPQIRLAKVIAPEVVVRADGVVRPTAPDGLVGGGFSWRAMKPHIEIREFYHDTREIRGSAELDATLLHELGHYLCGHGWKSRYRTTDAEQDEADAIGAALAEEYAEELNAPLEVVLARLSEPAW